MRGCIMRMLSAELCNEDYQSLEMAAKELDRTISRCGDKLRWPEPGHSLSVESSQVFTFMGCLWKIWCDFTVASSAFRRPVDAEIDVPFVAVSFCL